MKNNKYLFFGMLIMAMAFALVLTGCPTPDGSGTPTTPDEQAEQLAADLNAIKAGSAAAEGAKVTLTSEVGLVTSLTVPAGVTLDVPVGLTLDVTADGAKLALLNGAVLTVNGAVDAKAEGIKIDSAAASPAVIDGSGTIRLRSKGHLLGIWEGKKLTLDGVTLAGIEDNVLFLVAVGEGGELVLKSGAITGNAYIGAQWAGGGGVHVEGGVFRMEGGTISGNSATGSEWAGGGGVNVNDGTFTMKGGTISGNSAVGSKDGSCGGGGVHVSDGTFTMEGGTVSGNSATGGETPQGGGVSVGSDGTFTMKGGTITDNSATGGEWNGGGGVSMYQGVFRMEGGTITDNSATGGKWAESGGVFVGSDSTFTMKGGTISGNSATGSEWAGGGGVGIADSTFILEGGRIQGGTDSDGFAKNSVEPPENTAALLVHDDDDDDTATAKWGTGGTYTKGGAVQTGGSNIGTTDETLIAIPAK
jgi:hypothetical protein